MKHDGSEGAETDRRTQEMVGDGMERAMVASSPPPSAATVFGDRLGVAQQYCAILATDGIDHGLMGPREVPRLWDRHILNCACVEEVIESGESVVDIGSGAGLPGIPLAIARPDLTVTLIEPLLRRSEFLSRTVESLGLAVRVVRGRAEEKAVRAEVPLADVVTSRALAPLDRLSRWSAPLIRDGGRMIALKGSSAPDEIERDRKAAERNGIVDLRVQSVGVSVVDQPTTLVIGDKRGAPQRRRVR
ncbi:ribosomal RNA small subunit methyltransferase G [Gordonia aichiensis NBRC 108223]|uniref:Ribosomal RNA small subunit methyltransferase G n=1 Tax=Gordonia aichiensis NBRC 108223 TaxID=1220583 RepID=L7KM70_9ACTN|nr:ribosomal RNA small subunit methyltransferase G [Gordonia aichiensis NBRC 108223]